MTEMVGRYDPAARLRAGLLLLVIVGVVGTSFALAYDRHWLSPWQFAPWITLGLVIIATIALAVRQTALTVRLVRVVAVVTMVSALLGAWQHISANLDADPNGHDHAAHRESTATSGQAPNHHDEETHGDGHHHDDEGSDGDGHHHDDGKSESDGHHHDDEGSESDGHHDHDEESSSGEADESADEEGTSVSPSLVDVVIGAVGHAPIPAALSLAPIGLALGLATIGLGGSRTASKE